MSNTEDKKELLEGEEPVAEETLPQKEDNVAAETSDAVTPETCESNTAESSAEGEAPEQRKPAKKPHREYGARMLAFEAFYTQILAGVAAIIVVGIAVAVMFNVIVGASVAVSAAFFYKYTVDDRLKKSLGLSYKTAVGGLRLTCCKAVYGGVMWIPSRLLWHDVISIEASALRPTEKYTLTRIFLPRTLREISPDAFALCDTLKEIYFEGSEAEWRAIDGTDKLEGYSLLFDVKYPPIPKKKKVAPPKKDTSANTK